MKTTKISPAIARQQGDLRNFIVEGKDEAHDTDASDATLLSMVGRSKAVPKVSPQDDWSDRSEVHFFACRARYFGLTLV